MTDIATVIVDGVAVNKAALRAWLNSPEHIGAVSIVKDGEALRLFGTGPYIQAYTAALAGLGYVKFDAGDIVIGATTGKGVKLLADNTVVVANAIAAGLVSGADNARTLGSASFRFSTVYAGTGAINTSDEREKEQIGAIPDKWLDAWGAVDWSRFKFKDAVADKGKRKSRWHIGAVAQAVQKAFADRGLDAMAIGLLCFDEWPADKTAGTKAGNRYGLRYDECFAMEAAYQRRRMDRLEARLALIEPA